MICKKCGVEIPDDAVKCPACDAEVSNAEEVIENIPEVEEAYENLEEFVSVENVTKKPKKFLWLVVAAVIALIVAAVAFFGLSASISNDLNSLSKPSPIAKILGVKEEKVVVYVVTKKESNLVYVKTDKGEAYLVRKLLQNETFENNKEFVVKGNKLFYMNDEGGLSVMNIKNGKVTVIGDDFKAGTLSFSVKGDYLLYTGEDSMLYKSKNAKEATAVEFLGDTVFSNQLPNYGFVEGTNDFWYAVLDTETQNASVYLESGDMLLENVASVFHVSDKGNVIVYSMVTKEETIEPEPVDTAEGEAEKAEPVVVKTYALMLKEGAESVVLSDNYVASDSISIIMNDDNNGVLYIADKGEAPIDEETGEIVGAATGKLYFREFGGETKLLDENVAVALLLDEMNGSNYYYDASYRAEDDTIAYMKDNSLALLKDFEKVENPKEFDFLSSQPYFAEKNSFVLYNTFTPVEQPEQTEDGETTEKVNTPTTKLVYSTFEDGKWSDYTVIAENVQTYNYNEETGEVYYTLNDKGNMDSLSLYAYSVKDGKSKLIAEKTLGGYVAVVEKGVYYVYSFNTETGLAKIGHFDGETATVVVEDIAAFVATENGTIYTTKKDGENNDLYVILGNKLNLVCKHFTNVLFTR